MSFNSSSNASLLLPLLPSSSNSSISSPCFRYSFIFVIFTSFSITNFLVLLPLCILVLRLGLKRWQNQRSSSRAATTSHSDIFTYHMVAMEMIGVTGCCFFLCSAFFKVSWGLRVGLWLFSATTNGQVFFNVLSCLDRYLAVVHPIIYLRLRERGGVRVRNIIIGFVWLLYVGFFALNVVFSNNVIPGYCLSILSILVISFCSLAVLRALIRPGPGDGGGDRKRVAQSKMRAFYTIMAIMGALLFRFGGHLLALTFYVSVALSEEVRCGVLVSGVWFCLPSSLVLPLLFLHRAGNLVCCKNNNATGQGSEQSI